MSKKNAKEGTLKKWVFLILCTSCPWSCTSLPTPQHEIYHFPRKEAFLGKELRRAFEPIGTVRSKVNFMSLDPGHEELALCINYFNKSVRELVKIAKSKKGHAVIDVKSIVLLADGRIETYPRPECSDDGLEGQVLTEGTVVRWKD